MAGRRQKVKYEIVEHDEEKQETDENSRKCKIMPPATAWAILSTTVLIATYFVPSIGLTFYQRWLLLKYHYPLIVVLSHMVIKYLLAVVIRCIVAYKFGKTRINVGWKEYLIGVAPTGIFSGIDIGFSNWGLALNFITLYSMTKSTVIIFILIFSILFKLEKKWKTLPKRQFLLIFYIDVAIVYSLHTICLSSQYKGSWSLCIIVVLIALGLFLLTYKSPEFNVFGFILLLIASIASGLRWTCAQLILQKSKMGMKNPIDMIFHMQPWMIVSIVPFAFFLEGQRFIKNINELDNVWHFIVLGALLGFFMEITEILVVTYTSSLTLSIAGIFKEIIIVTLAVIFNGDTLSFINTIGLLVCMGGITCHVIHKLKTTPMQNMSKNYDFESEHHELGRSLIDDTSDQILENSDIESDKSDTQELFNILNTHDR